MSCQNAAHSGDPSGKHKLYRRTTNNEGKRQKEYLIELINKTEDDDVPKEQEEDAREHLFFGDNNVHEWFKGGVKSRVMKDKTSVSEDLYNICTQELHLVEEEMKGKGLYQWDDEESEIEEYDTEEDESEEEVRSGQRELLEYL